jgi:argininosuccinate lyase
MYLIADIKEMSELIKELLSTLLGLAKQHTQTIMPGFTHLQKAQPITLSHHLLAYFQMFKRDRDRLLDCLKRANEMPLGSGALAATVYPIDRDLVKSQLGFAAITQNSLDGVSDRDYCIEYVSDLSIIMMHLSRFCEELIIWSTDSFGFIEISDAYSTGSSIMPQKKNPDMAELIRGKTGRVYGNLVGLLTMMKGLPLAYNKDMQEDKEAVFEASDTAKACLAVFTGMISGTDFKKDVLYKSALGGYTNATDAADWLVRRGVTFRDAHEIIGKLVRHAISKGQMLQELSIEDFKSISEVFDEGVFDAITVKASVSARNVPGGPAEEAVLNALRLAEEYLK